MNSRVGSRAVFAAVVLSSALISGGWFVERGLAGTTGASLDGQRLYEEVLNHVARDFIDTLPDSTLFLRSVDGVIGELHDPHSTYLTPARLARLLGNGVGYVDLNVFSEESANDLRRSIDSLRGAGMRSLILDLRADPGGLLDQGVAVSDLFLDAGQRIVGMRGRTADAN